GAVEILFSRQIKEAKEEDKEALRAKLAKEYSDKFASPYQTASTGSLDEVIEPATARARLIGAFRFLSGKRRPGEHERTGNIPL
ncbi:MAG TPA: carboxyl transferase domain-containing protein, partial [Elusimicrobiales bacterium]|nr:carboxyl transferase domain-containing protein [Elusimicrobiales bacterium]